MKPKSKMKTKGLLRSAVMIILVLAMAFAVGGCKDKDSSDAVATEPAQQTQSAETQQASSENEAASDAWQDDASEDDAWQGNDSWQDGDSRQNGNGSQDYEMLDEDSYYTSADDVALYIYTYKHLPDNYITKRQARDLGWQGGNPTKVCNGKSIGGDHFGNYEGLLPRGEDYYECDVNYPRNSRGSERLIYTRDGTVYYTADHYESFQLLYESD